MKASKEWAHVTGCALRRHDEGMRMSRDGTFEEYCAGLEKKREKQIQCGKCLLWMFDSERCGLFEAM